MKASSPKIQRRHLSGVFLLNKPLGISSNAALQRVRWLYRAQKPAILAHWIRWHPVYCLCVWGGDQVFALFIRFGQALSDDRIFGT